MVPQVIWVLCSQIGRTAIGRLAVSAIVRIIPLMSRRIAVSYFKKQPKQAVLIIRQMARLFRQNSARSTESVAREAIKPFRGVLDSVDETTAVNFFSELWNYIIKDVKLLEIILRS